MSRALLRVCQRCAALGNLQLGSAYLVRWNVATYSNTGGYDPQQAEMDIWRGKIFNFLHSEHYIFSIPGIKMLKKKRDKENLQTFQRFNAQMLTVLGPDKWAASFVCTFKGQVKLLNDVVWISSVNLLESIETVEVEGIDASSMVLFPVGLDNLRGLKHLRFIKFGWYITDWYLFHLQHLGPALEFVDISGCINITEAGIASLAALKNLKCLNISDCTNVKSAGILAIHLESILPELTIIGLETISESEDKFLQEEKKSSRFLQMGEQKVPVSNMNCFESSNTDNRSYSSYDLEENSDRTSMNRQVDS